MAGDSGGGHGANTGVWIAVAIIIMGSILSGIALIEWIWWLFYTGVGLMVVGCIVAYFADIMDMVTEFGSGAAAAAEIETS
jgi:hypothetical protein